VRTRATSLRRTAAPAESVEALDVPVVTVLPARRAEPDLIALGEQAAQQQQ
jgi:hypothetical protein